MILPSGPPPPICPAGAAILHPGRAGSGDRRDATTDWTSLLAADWHRDREAALLADTDADPPVRVGESKREPILGKGRGGWPECRPVDRGAVVAFDGWEVRYGFGELDELVPAYATTIHKAKARSIRPW